MTTALRCLRRHLILVASECTANKTHSSKRYRSSVLSCARCLLAAKFGLQIHFQHFLKQSKRKSPDICGIIYGALTSRQTPFKSDEKLLIENWQIHFQKPRLVDRQLKCTEF